MRDIPLGAIEDAARAIDDPIVRTPTVRLDVPAVAPTRLAGSAILLKPETLQPIGSFLRRQHRPAHLRIAHRRVSLTTDH